MKLVQLRGWQQEAFAKYKDQLSRGEKSALWEATPGAGKTTAALEVIKHQLVGRLAKTALIVVPTSHLRIQWARAAAKVGIDLDSAFGGTRKALTSEFHGAVVTYQQFGNRKELFKDLASRSIVILDEVHHTGDGLHWGNAIQESLINARFVLCLSGTAFRSDNNPIPFVKYDQDGVSVPDYSYSYARAVEDNVCRPTAVFTYGGEVSWEEHGIISTANFSDALDKTLAARRHRAALDPNAGWIQPMLKDAHETLKATRKEHPEAGALMVCADQTHARQMAGLIGAISGEKPTVVLSDDSGASKKIKQFADSDSMWLVACNMVSEGVDIPRLRVGVYGTTIRTKMYFRQFLGRIVRKQRRPPGLQISYLYIPADSVLHQLAEEIEQECRHVLNKPRDEWPEKDRDSQSAERAPQSWSAVSAINSGVDAVLVHGNQLALFGGISQPNEDVHAIVQREVALHLEERLTRSETKTMLASDIQRLVGSYHRKSGKPHSVIHTLLNKTQGVRSQTHCTEDQLRSRRALLEKLLSEESHYTSLH